MTFLLLRISAMNLLTIGTVNVMYMEMNNDENREVYCNYIS